MTHPGRHDQHWTLAETLVWAHQIDPEISVRQALAILRELCRSGLVSAMGRPCVWPHPMNYHETLRNSLAADERWRDGIVAILPEDWADLCFVVDDLGQPTGDLNSTATRRKAWASIRFSVNSLIRSRFGEWDRIKARQTRDLRARTTSRRERSLRRVGKWVSVAEMVDWIVKEDRAGRTGQSIADVLAHVKGSFEETLNAAPRPRAYREFWNALQDGEFDRDGKTRVLLLNSTTTWARLTPGRGRWAFETHGWDTFVSQFLDCSWIEIELADHWLAGWIPRNLYQRWAAIHARLSPQHSDEAGGAERSRFQGRVGYVGALELFMAKYRDEALSRLSDNAIARAFQEDQGKRGEPSLALPQLRHIANQVKKIRHARRMPAVDSTARNGT